MRADESGSGSTPRRPILLANLGSPASTAVKDVRAYLREFLMDERVLDVPYLLRKFIVEARILPKRSRESAHAYRRVWWSEGSPLIVLSRRVERLLRERVAAPLSLAMRYGEPSVETALDELIPSGTAPPAELFLLPLYPHYAMSSYETVVARVRRALARRAPGARLLVQRPFYDDPAYIAALVERSRPFLEESYDHLLFSYHGLPERHLRKSDPTGRHCLASPDCCRVESPAHATCYRHQVLRTTELFVESAGIEPGRWSVAFQSRLGRDPWLRPYTDKELTRLAREGVRRLVVICPAFVADCLETLEEIGLRGQDAFLAAGGEELRLIPCLNDHPRWIETLAGFCRA